MTNQEIARRLCDYAHQLATGNDNLFRVRAYRQGAALIESLEGSVEEYLAEKGREALAKQAGIGKHLAFTIEHLVRTGQLRPYPSRRTRTCA